MTDFHNKFACIFPQTLLHEMIHALLFVTQNNKDRDGHGPEFCKHMNRINKDSGTNITVGITFYIVVVHYIICDYQGLNI